MNTLNQLKSIKVRNISYAFYFMFFFLTQYLKAQNKIRIDPAHAYGAKASEYFDSVEYIPLETTKQSLFGDPFQLIVTDSSYVISDIDTQSILFFSLDGKLKKRIFTFARIIYNKSQNVISVFGNGKDLSKIIIENYTLLGNKIESVATSFNFTDGFSNKHFFLVPLNKHYSLLCNAYSADKQISTNLQKSFFFVSIYKDGNMYKEFIPIEKQNEMTVGRIRGGITRPEIINEGIAYISTPLDFNLYKITSDTAIKICQLVFPTSRMLSRKIQESKDVHLIDSINNVIKRNQTLIIDIENIFFVNSKLFFKIKTPAYGISHNSSANEYQYNFLYDTISNKLSSIDRVTLDNKSYFLPFMGESSKKRGFMYQNNNLYGYVSSLEMFSAYQKNISKSPQYPPVLQEYFRTQSRKSNPVIVRMKLKE